MWGEMHLTTHAIILAIWWLGIMIPLAIGCVAMAVLLERTEERDEL
jgi:hypothetical protein